MKITNFKKYPLLIAVSIFLALSGCDRTTGISSDSGLGGTPPPLTEEQCLLAAGPNGYGTIVINDKTWLDRNLGAIQAATSSTDPDAHGDLYQWGRSTEGHQDRTSDTNDTLADTIDNVQNTAWEGKFITTTSDWVDTGVDDNGTLRSQAWSTPNDVNTNPNQVCPCGYVVPTQQDFIDLNLTASNTRDKFKLTYAGWRQNTDGIIQQVDTRAFFWTSSVNSANNDRTNLYYYTPTLETQFDTTKRAHGYSIRCIKP